MTLGAFVKRQAVAVTKTSKSSHISDTSTIRQEHNQILFTASSLAI